MMKIKKTMITNIRKTSMKNHFIIWVFVLACATIAAQTKKWSLQDCVNHALENNITVKKGENNLLSMEQDVIASKGSFLPYVGANVSQSLSLGQSELFPGNFVNRTFHSTNASISVSQTVFNGYRNVNAYKQAKLSLESNKLGLDKIKDDISLFVVNAYLNVLFNKENLQVAKAQYEFSIQQLEQVKNLVNAGAQPRANIYDAEATLSKDEQSLTIAENSLNLSLLSLSQLLQVSYEGFDVEVINIISPSEGLLYKEIAPILNYALENRVEIKVAEKNIEIASLSTELSKGGYLPTVSLGYGFNSGANFSNLINSNSFFEQMNENKGHSLSLSVNIPIFTRFQNKTAVEKSKIQEDNSQLDLEQAKLDLESNIQQAYTDAHAALKAFSAAKKSLASQELAFENSKERFNIGSMTSFDLEQARIRLINAQSSLINAKYDFVFKTKVLDFYMGKSLTN